MFSSDTDLLTSEGFVPFPEIDMDHQVAVFDPRSAAFIGFDFADRVLEADYDDKMLRMSGKLSLCVTPDSYLYVSLSKSPQKRIHPDFDLRLAVEPIQRAQALYQAPLRLRRAAQVRNSSEAILDPEMYAFGQLIGFFIGDGSIESKNQIVFYLKKARKQNYLRALATRIPYDLKEKGNRFIFNYPFLGERWGQWFYSKEGHKRLHPAIFAGTVPYYLGILDGLKNSDGYQRSDRAGWEYATTSPYLIRDIQAVGALVGEAFSVTETVPGTYRLYTLRRQLYPHINDPRKQVAMELIDYLGRVHDVMVPGNLICIRHDYSTLLCGSARWISNAHRLYD